jgi:hypothetical protein
MNKLCTLAVITLMVVATIAAQPSLVTRAKGSAPQLQPPLAPPQPVHERHRPLDQGGETWETATVIPSLPFFDAGHLGQTDDCDGVPYCDVFYTYTAVASGEHLFDMCNGAAEFYGQLRVWVNPTAPCMAPAYYDAVDECSNSQPRMTVNLNAGDVAVIECGTGFPWIPCNGQSYVLSVDGPNLTQGRCCYGEVVNPTCGIMTAAQCAALSGTFAAGITDCNANPCIPRAGDICETAFPLTIPSTVTGTTVGYANDYDVGWGCHGTGWATGPDVVYRYTPTTDIGVNLDLCQSDYEARTEIYRDVCTGDPYACSDGGCAHYRHLMRCVRFDAGHTYYIVIDGSGSGAGEYTLVSTISDCIIYPYPPNDSCAHAVPIVVNGDSICSTALGSTPDCSGGPEVWYTFTTTDMMDVVVSMCGSPTPAGVVDRMFRGSCCGSIVNFDCWTNGLCPDQSWSEMFRRLPPDSYWLPVRAGDFCVRVTGTVSPPPLVCTCTEPAEGRYCNTNGMEYGSDNPDIPITVPVQYHVTKVTLCLELWDYTDYPNVLSLVSPSGTVVALSVHRGANCQHFLCTRFDDAADQPIASGWPPFSGSFVPDSPLSTFNGENALGTWNLHIDHSVDPEDWGYLEFVCLNFEWDQILAVELTSFEAAPGDRQVTLNWQTASESNNDHFELERDGQMIASVPTRGNGSTVRRYAWTDHGLTNGQRYHYTLSDVDINGSRHALRSVDAVPKAAAAEVTEYALHQNYPNPFNPSTEIVFGMKESGLVTIAVYNLAGQKVAVLVNREMPQGRHAVSFHAAGLPSGVYLYKMMTSGFTAQRKMLLIK